MTRYDEIGHGYAVTRREDPRIVAAIEAALADAETVVNVGAGTGSYEPRSRRVVAIEPSEVMAAQRPAERVPAVLATADRLPLIDDAVDAAMTVLSLHHWDEHRRGGVAEMRRVARGPVVIVTYDAEVSSAMWLMADYLPEVAALDRRTFPPIRDLKRWLGGTVTVRSLPLHRDTPDWMLGSFWAHPERVLDAAARQATSGFARMDPDVVSRVVDAVRRDVDEGRWDAKHGHLRALDELDVGLRLVVGHPGRSVVERRGRGAFDRATTPSEDHGA